MTFRKPASFPSSSKNKELYENLAVLVCEIHFITTLQIVFLAKNETMEKVSLITQPYGSVLGCVYTPYCMPFVST